MIIAEFEVKPGKPERFLELVELDWGHSVANGPGCRLTRVQG